MFRFLVFSVLVVSALAVSIHKRLPYCDTDSDCPLCTSYDYGCVDNKCFCDDYFANYGASGKRQVESCKTDVDCAGHTCHHGAPHCEIHDPNMEHGHCNCHVPHKRQAESCKTDVDCASHTCHHGAPHCEIHDPNMEHGHCNCHVPH
ncbi:low-density lipoprotein receptor-related protein 2-like [Ruditapes philippinarum]|uniref:low-density lipoprotein receptor-related protein 2-like n=1 Tax=Ruditapes philippinarum TaxID=129788 RepID=UPI00295A828D|nr:low-density lipoprotein receptor-related protein 2-like [Ruditapes philippinarum]